METVIRQRSFTVPGSTEKLAKEVTVRYKDIYKIPFGTSVWWGGKMWAILNPHGFDAVKNIDPSTGRQAKEGKSFFWQVAKEEPARLHYRNRNQVLTKGNSFSTHTTQKKEIKRTGERLKIII